MTRITALTTAIAVLVVVAAVSTLAVLTAYTGQQSGLHRCPPVPGTATDTYVNCR
jgi:hypothetical protein